VLLLAPSLFVFVTQAQVQSQVPGDLPVVIDEAPIEASRWVEKVNHRHRSRARIPIARAAIGGRHRADEEGRKAIAGEQRVRVDVCGAGRPRVESETWVA